MSPKVVQRLAELPTLPWAQRAKGLGDRAVPPLASKDKGQDHCFDFSVTDCQYPGLKGQGQYSNGLKRRGCHPGRPGGLNIKQKRIILKTLSIMGFALLSPGLAWDL